MDTILGKRDLHSLKRLGMISWRSWNVNCEFKNGQH